MPRSTSNHLLPSPHCHQTGNTRAAQPGGHRGSRSHTARGTGRGLFVARKPLNGSAHTGAAYRHDLAGVSAPPAAEVGAEPGRLVLGQLDAKGATAGPCLVLRMPRGFEQPMLEASVLVHGLRAVLQRAKVRSSDSPQERSCRTPLALASLDQRPQVCSETFGFVT